MRSLSGIRARLDHLFEARDEENKPPSTVVVLPDDGRGPASDVRPYPRLNRARRSGDRPAHPESRTADLAPGDSASSSTGRCDHEIARLNPRPARQTPPAFCTLAAQAHDGRETRNAFERVLAEIEARPAGPAHPDQTGLREAQAARPRPGHRR